MKPELRGSLAVRRSRQSPDVQRFCDKVPGGLPGATEARPGSQGEGTQSHDSQTLIIGMLTVDRGPVRRVTR